MLYNFLLGLETILSIAIVILILLHRGRGSEAGAVFTGSASASVFGSRGSTPFLTKLIASLAFVFILNSLSLAYIANRDFGSGSVILEEVTEQDEQPAEDFPIDDEVLVDEFIDDIPDELIETELESDISDIPDMDDNNEIIQQEDLIPAIDAETDNREDVPSDLQEDETP